MTTIRLTRYFLINSDDYHDPSFVPVYDDSGNIIATVSAHFFADCSLEGSGRLSDGRVINVTGHYVACPQNVAMALKQIADMMYRSRYSYVGLTNDCSHYFTYKVSPEPWGLGSHGNPLLPFAVVASDPHYYPYGTVLFAPQLQGLQLPNQGTHDGYLYCGDTGGAIKGPNHCDWFVGIKAWQLNHIVPDYIDIEVYKTP